MSQRRLCLFTQTPLYRFLKEIPALEGGALDARRLAALHEGEDYERTPGGVSRMVEAFLGRLMETSRLDHATWVSLAKLGPSRIRQSDRVTLECPRIAPEDTERYAVAKTALWDAMHGLGDPDARPPVEVVARGLDALSAAFAARASGRAFDAYYVHDFQLLPLARRLPAGVPRLFRWHIPVPEAPFPYQDYVARELNQYDAVIVSTRRNAERLRKAGVTVPVHARHPYLDESRTRVVTTDDLAAFDAQWGIGPDDAVFALVARMDPMKSQDVAIRALAAAATRAPNAKLLLIGGGGFSGGKRGGLALPHVAEWRGHLESLAAELGVADRVVFTGNLLDADLDVAYTRARAVLLPSVLEGFGLAAVEGWLFGRPVVVSRGAGVAELVREGENGYAFEPGDVDALADRIARLALDADLADRLGAEGRVTAGACHLETGADGVWRILRALIEDRAPPVPDGFRGRGP